MNENTPNRTTNSNPVGNAPGAGSVDQIAKSAHDGINAASKAAHPTIDRAAAGAHRAIESADEMANHAAQAIDKAGAKGEEMITASTTYMREHPVITLGLAVTAGYVLSRLLTSR